MTREFGFCPLFAKTAAIKATRQQDNTYTQINDDEPVQTRDDVRKLVDGFSRRLT